MIANHAVGAHNIDMPACRARGVVATTTPGVLTEAPPTGPGRCCCPPPGASAKENAGCAPDAPGTGAPTFLLGAALTGATLGILGILGAGRIGQAIARRAPGFGMQSIYHNRHQLPGAIEQALQARWRPLDELLESSDALIVACPLTPETQHLLDAGRLAQLKPTAVLVSITGGVVDEAALAQALDRQQLFAAALDSYTNEPAVHPALLRHESMTLTPHLGSATIGPDRTWEPSPPTTSSPYSPDIHRSRQPARERLAAEPD